jgi:phosphomevalonate kinase
MVLVILISGKRFAGKDSFSAILKEEISFSDVHILHLANELKRAYAKQFGADFNRLLTDREYKVDFISSSNLKLRRNCIEISKLLSI